METQILIIVIILLSVTFALNLNYKVSNLNYQIRRQESTIQSLTEQKEFYKKNNEELESQNKEILERYKAIDLTCLNLRNENKSLNYVGQNSINLLEAIIKNGNRYLTIDGDKKPALRLSYNEQFEKYEMKLYKNNQDIEDNYDYIINNQSAKKELDTLSERLKEIKTNTSNC